MKKLFFIFISCLLLAETTYAAIDGDPFSDEQDFSEIQEIDTPKTFFVGGFIESRNQLSLYKSSPPISLRQEVHVDALWKYNDFSLFGSLKGNYEGAAPLWNKDNYPLSAELHEMYMTYDTEIFDIFLGRKTHRWGMGDGINPMDLINPLDTSDPISSGRADNRVPVWLFSGTMSMYGISLEAIFLPKAEVNELPSFDNPWEPRSLNQLRQLENAGLINIDQSSKPDNWFQDIEYGGRLSTTVSGWDLSIMAFYGYSDNPIFVSKQQNNMLNYNVEYPTFSAFGVSFAKGFGSQTIRGEAAFKPNFPFQGLLGVNRANLWQGVLGWDYDIDGRYYLNFQVFADIQEGTNKIKDHKWFGAAYEISAKWLRDALKAGIRGKIYTKDGTLTEIFLEYTFDDHWKVSTGIMYWTGDENTILGEYTDNDFSYLTLRYTF